MKVFENRLRWRRRECAERRTYLAELELLGEQLRADQRRLLDEIAQPGATDDPPLNERHRKLERSLAEIDGQIATARDALIIAEQEVRQQERALAQRKGAAAISAPLATRRTRRAGRAAPRG